MIAIYAITSGLHDEQSVAKISDAFLRGIFPDGGFDFRGDNFQDFGSHTLDLIYVRTGGAEGIFKSLLPEMLARGIERYYLLTSGKSNSLAASLEILSYLRQQGLQGEVLHGSPEYLKERVKLLEKVRQPDRRHWTALRLADCQPCRQRESDGSPGRTPGGDSHGGTPAGDCQGSPGYRSGR